MATTDPATQTFTTPSGGVMTREVGAITGDVEIWIAPASPDRARIRYTGAEDTYTVTGGVRGRTLDEIVRVLSADPGQDKDGNPGSTALD